MALTISNMYTTTHLLAMPAPSPTGTTWEGPGTTPAEKRYFEKARPTAAPTATQEEMSSKTPTRDNHGLSFRRAIDAVEAQSSSILHRTSDLWTNASDFASEHVENQKGWGTVALAAAGLIAGAVLKRA